MSHGGDILLYINKSYYARTISLVHNFELIGKLFYSYLLIVVYSPPSMYLINTIDLCDFISNLLVSSNSCLIYGYFNLPGIDWLTGSGYTRIEKYFYSFTQKEALVQLVDFNNRKSNILDLILTNNICIVSSISLTNPFEYDKHMSDHISIYSCILHTYSSSNTSNHYFCY